MLYLNDVDLLYCDKILAMTSVLYYLVSDYTFWLLLIEMFSLVIFVCGRNMFEGDKRSKGIQDMMLQVY